MKDLNLFTGIKNKDNDLIVKVYDTAIAFPMPSGFWKMFYNKLLITKKKIFSIINLGKEERLFIDDLIDLCRKKIIEENRREQKIIR